MKRIALLLGALALAAGCSGSGSSSSSSGTTGVGTTTTTASSSSTGTTGHPSSSSSSGSTGTTASGSSSGSTGSTTAGTSSGSSTGTTGACTEISFGQFAGFNQGSVSQPSFVFDSTLSPSLGDATLPDGSQIELYGPNLGTYTGSGTFDFSTGADNNYATCNECVLLFQDLDQNGQPAKTFFQSSGTFDITSADTAGGFLHGTLSDVKFVEVTIDPNNNYTSTPVPGGACLHLTSASVDSPATGWTCDPMLWGDGSCDCGCGVQDIDCQDATAVSCATCAACGPGSDCGSLVNASDNSQCINSSTSGSSSTTSTSGSSGSTTTSGSGSTTSSSSSSSTGSGTDSGSTGTTSAGSDSGSTGVSPTGSSSGSDSGSTGVTGSGSGSAN